MQTNYERVRDAFSFLAKEKGFRHYTDAEIIAGLRKALEAYADEANWIRGNIFSNENDISKDDCSGYYRKHGEIARQALNQFSESSTISCDILTKEKAMEEFEVRFSIGVGDSVSMHDVDVPQIVKTSSDIEGLRQSVLISVNRTFDALVDPEKFQRDVEAANKTHAVKVARDTMPEYEFKHYISVGRFGELTKRVDICDVRYYSGYNFEELRRLVHDEVDRAFDKENIPNKLAAEKEAQDIKDKITLLRGMDYKTYESFMNDLNNWWLEK